MELFGTYWSFLQLVFVEKTEPPQALGTFGRPNDYSGQVQQSRLWNGLELNGTVWNGAGEKKKNRPTIQKRISTERREGNENFDCAVWCGRAAGTGGY